VASSLHGASKTALIGGIQFGGSPPEGVLDDLMNNVDPSDPYGGPVWGMQSGDIGSTYEYAGQPTMLAGQPQMPESWVDMNQQGRPVIMQPNSGNFQYMPNPRARAMRMGLAGQMQMPESWVGQSPKNQPVVVQPNSGNFQYIPNPRANKKTDTTQSKMQKLWMFNMGYEHHEQPPIYFGGSARKENTAAESLAAAPTAKLQNAKLQKLWMFNMGYEHHEQPPIYFGGSARKENTAAESLAVAPTAAREMQLWGWPQQQQMMAGQAQMPESWVGQAQSGRPVVVEPNSGNFQYHPTPHANKKADTTQSKMQKLWMFNMGYEHHEQPPIYFGSARKENNVATSM